jgi:flagellar basal body P-ring formation protein FlgA
MFNIIKLVIIITIFIQINLIAGIIELNDEVVISGDEILLSDLIKENPMNIELPDLSLGNAPLPGRIRNLHKNQILYRLSLTDFDKDMILPDIISVRSDYQKVDIELAGEIIIEHIESKIKNEYDKYAIEIIRFNNRNSKVPVGKLDYSVRLNNRSELKGKIIGYLDVSINDELVSTINFVVEIKTWKKFPVLNTEIGHNEIIKDEMIQEILIDTTRTNTLNSITDKKELVSKMARRNINAGNIIMNNHLAEPYAVERREIVDVIVEQNGFKIKTSAQAMQSGAIGDRIRLLNLNSNKTFFAKISNVNEVIVR